MFNRKQKATKKSKTLGERLMQPFKGLTGGRSGSSKTAGKRTVRRGVGSGRRGAKGAARRGAKRAS